MRKILITSIGFSTVVKGGGGISAYTYDLANNLERAGNTITVFVIREQFDFGYSLNENKKFSVKIFKIPEKKSEERKLVENIYHEISIVNPDIIIDNGTSYIPGLWSYLAEDIIKISVVHAFSPRYVTNNFGIMGKMSTYNHQYVDWFVCQNSRMADDISRRYNIPRKKLVFIPQTATHSFKPRNEEENKKLKILFGAGSRKNKGADVMFEICKKLKETRWNFEVCWCSNAKGYERYLSEDTRFVFPGHISRNAFLLKVAESDVIIIPTLQDTGPMLLVEAMSFGVVPICNNLVESAIPDIITHGENGFLVDKNNVSTYIEVIYSLINNEVFLKHIAANTYDYFKNYLKPDKQLEAFLNLFEKNKQFNQKSRIENLQIAYWHLRSTNSHFKYSFFRLKKKIIEFFELIEVKDLQ